MRHLLSQKRCTTNNFETMISMIPFQFRTGWKALVIACFVFQCILVNAGSGAGSGADSEMVLEGPEWWFQKFPHIDSAVGCWMVPGATRCACVLVLEILVWGFRGSSGA